MADESGLHPIAEVLAAALSDGPDGTPHISPEGVAAVEKALDEYLAAGPALMGAVDQVLTAAHLLEVEKGAEQPALALVALVDRKKIVDALIAINDANEAARAEAVAKQADQFQRFTAADGPKRAPAPQEEAKDGAVKLDAFHFPKRL